MNDILKKAEELGSAIKSSDIYREYREISSMVAENDDEMALLQKFTELTQRLSQKEHGMIEIEHFEKEEYQELIQQIEDDDMLKSYIAAQNDFFELMKQVEKCMMQ